MSTQPPHIRRAVSADVSLLSYLIRTAFHDVAERFGLTPENCPKHPSNCTDEWILRDFTRNVMYYILENRGIPAGCAALEKAGGGLCYLERLAVLPVYRKRGVGTALMKHVLREAQVLDAEKVSIGIIAAHTDLKEWYLKRGFSESETKEFEHLPFQVTFMEYDVEKCI